MADRRWIPWTAVALSVAAGAALASSCGGDGPGPARPLTDTRETARREAAAFFRPDPDRIPHEVATNPGTPWGDYLGSRACQPCHQKDYDGWRDSYHSRTLYDAAPPTVFADFGKDAKFSDPRYAWEVFPWSVNGKYGVRIRRNPRFQGGATDTYGKGLPPRSEGSFEILYSFGNRRHQPYVVRLETGEYWVLPVYWNDVRREWMWDGWRPYVNACGHCHVTGIKNTMLPSGEARLLPMTIPSRWKPEPSEEGWAEGAVGCEVCHGPGRRHVDFVNEMGNAAYRDYLESGGAPTIYNPKHDTAEARMSQCDACHNFHSESSVTWVPGPKGYDHAMGRQPMTPATNANQFWADGTHISPCTVGRVFRESPMGRKGVECRDCHDAHGNAHWAELTESSDDNALCIKCHGDFADVDRLVRHTHHPAEGPGSRCVECHMPRDKRFSNGVQIMSAQIHSHAMSTPTGEEMPPPGGPGPSCNTCHTDRDTAWTRRTLAEWKATPQPPGAPPQRPPVVPPAAPGTPPATPPLTTPPGTPGAEK